MKKQLVLLGLTGLIGVFLFMKFGSSIYIPMINKLRGKETVASIVEKIAAKVHHRLAPNLKEVGLEALPDEIILVGIKDERKLEVYAKTEEAVQLLKTYPFTAFSGQLGPKLKEGDGQIPEGIYQIEYLNPNSAYYLSMKVNYPNAFDREQALLDRRDDIGKDIFIHGKATTIGCIPIGDEGIEELFILAQKAFDRGITVIITPKDFRKSEEVPLIQGIEWTAELYQKIKNELDELTGSIE